LKIYNLKRMTIPKVAVLVTGLTAAVLVATINPAPAQATPRASNCTGCHAGATTSTVTATPSTATPAPGATYQVAITLTANPNGGNTGYGIVPIAPAVEKTFGGNTGTQLAFTATMVAPTAAGTYSYTVWTNQGPTDGTGQVGSKIYSITVAPVVTTPPPTTTTTTPPTTTTTTTPPPAGAFISALSPKHGVIGTMVTIQGSGFGAAGTMQFGTVVATASSWTSTAIVFYVPVGTYSKFVPVTVTVIPGSGTASSAVRFRFDHVRVSKHSHSDAPRHHVRLGGDFD